MKITLLPRFKYFLLFLMIIGFLFYKMNRLLYEKLEIPSKHLKVSSAKSFDGIDMTSTSLTESEFTTNGTQILILLWTKYFGGDQWTKLRLDQMNCSFSNCLLTDNRRHLDTSDAVLFHWRDIDTKDLPEYHKPNQKWVLYNWESPHYTFEESIEPLAKDFDWMMTYRRDSDIYVPYGSLYKCDRKWNNEDLFHKKTKSIAWIVSNCLTQSNRETFVKELGVYIDVDIYGYCGQHQCSRDHSCFQMIQNKYKFYLSFENSLCKDYVTEKLFRTLEYDIIPIVYGSADYHKLLPNNSFIDTKDFSSPKELSEYLKVVSSDKQKYNSYLQWKSSYCVRQTDYRYFCDLCQKLNQNSIRNINNNIVIDSNDIPINFESNKRDVIEWWFSEAECHHRNTADIQSNSIFNSIMYSFISFVCILVLS